MADQRGYLAPGVARNDHGAVLDLMSHEVKVRQRSIHGYRESGVAKRQVHTVGETLNGFSRNTSSVEFLANVGSDLELA